MKNARLPLLGICAILSLLDLYCGEKGKAKLRKQDDAQWTLRDDPNSQGEIDIRAEQFRQFRRLNDKIKAELKLGKTTLKEAARTVRAAAPEDYPCCINPLGEQFGQVPVDAQIAMWLLAQLAADWVSGDLTPKEVCQTEYLRTEMELWLNLDTPELKRLLPRLSRDPSEIAGWPANDGIRRPGS